jgi:hypothetical protein
MRSALLSAVLAACVAGQEAGRAPAPESAEACVRAIVSAETTWQLVDACEKRLAGLPAREVMPLLAREPFVDMPGGGIYNSGGSAERDRDARVEWRAFYSLRRVWDALMRNAEIEDLRIALVAASGGKTDDDLACVELYRHHRKYSKDGEPRDPRDRIFFEAGERVMRDSRRPADDRIKGAGVVLRQGARKAEVCEFALSLPIGPTLFLPSTEGLDRILEARVITRAFEHVEAQVAAHPDNVHFGYNAVRGLERIIGRIFAPAHRDPKYRGEHGLKPEFFSETVANALAWWKEHQQEYTPAAAESRRAAEDRAKAEADQREHAAGVERARNAAVPLKTGQRRHVTLGSVVTFPTEREATQYCIYAGSPRSAKAAEDWVSKHGTIHDLGTVFEVVQARGDALARARFLGDSEVVWVSSRQAAENAAAER